MSEQTRLTCPYCSRSFASFISNGRRTIRKHSTYREWKDGYLYLYRTPIVCTGSHVGVDEENFYIPVENFDKKQDGDA